MDIAVTQKPKNEPLPWTRIGIFCTLMYVGFIFFVCYTYTTKTVKAKVMKIMHISFKKINIFIIALAFCIGIAPPLPLVLENKPRLLNMLDKHSTT